MNTVSLRLAAALDFYVTGVVGTRKASSRQQDRRVATGIPTNR